MRKRLGSVRALLMAIVALLGVGCRTAYVVLGNDAGSSGTTSGAGGTAGAGGVGGTSGAGGIGGGGIGGFGAAGCGSVAGTVAGTGGACAPNEDALERCAFALPDDTYGYNACLNHLALDGGGGIGGAPTDRCEGYAPCSEQHEACLYYYTDGSAGSDVGANGGCAGAPGDQDWLDTCGGYFNAAGGSGGASAAGGAGGVAGMTAGAGGEGGATGGEGGG